MRFCFGLLLLTVAAPASLTADIVVIDFENLASGDAVTTQYPGLTFSNATVLTAGISLNEFELPPHSGTNVAVDDGGPISVAFAMPVIGFGGYFTYYEPITLVAFDALNNEAASATSVFSTNVACGDGPPCLGDPGSSPNEFLQVAFTGGISSVTITGDPAGTSFVMDDATYTTAVPEPGSLLLLAAECLVLIAFKKMYQS